MDISWKKRLHLLSLRYLSWVLPRTAAQQAQDLFLTPVRVPRPQSEMAWYESAQKYFLKNGNLLLTRSRLCPIILCPFDGESEAPENNFSRNFIRDSIIPTPNKNNIIINYTKIKNIYLKCIFSSLKFYSF